MLKKPVGETEAWLNWALWLTQIFTYSNIKNDNVGPMLGQTLFSLYTVIVMNNG